MFTFYDCDHMLDVERQTNRDTQTGREKKNPRQAEQ